MDEIVEAFTAIHARLRVEVGALDEAGCNWAPGEGTNSVGVLVTHVLGSEAETFAAVLGRSHRRDRDAELRRRLHRRSELLGLLDTADATLASCWGPALARDPSRLAASVRLPTRPDDDRRTGAAWLATNLAHAAEHLGHVGLTAQLYRDARRRARS